MEWKPVIPYKEREKTPRENALSAEGTVRDILTDVRARGDEAVQDYTERFDGFRPPCLRVEEGELKKARSSLDKETEEALVFAAERIENFARAQRGCLKDLRYEISPGVVAGHRLIPLRSCGCYVPAGRYPLPSSALMSVIPARVAGVKRIAACSPGQKDGKGIHPAVLAALDIAGADEVYSMGGAQAIGAFAWGTETIPPVDMIVGPGNRYVAEAKRQASGSVGIDMLAGPSEAVILADGSPDPEWVAADLLAQSEHDADAWAVLITTSPSLAEAVAREVARQGKLLSTGEAALESWRRNGRILIADSLEEGVAAANEIAPEHLQIMTEDDALWAERMENYGSLFLGAWSPVAFGDYLTGPNHILPTGRNARFSSGVSVGTFLRTSSFQELTPEGAASLAPPCARLAAAEGLFGHRRSAELRGEDPRKG